MSPSFRGRHRLMTIAAVVAAVAVTATVDAQAAPEPVGATDKPAVVVSLGDSYISGEAGRWRGNALNDDGDKWGTDLATRCEGRGCSTNTQWVYGNSDSDTNKCHRSTSAEIASAGIEDVKAVNLACSGATTSDVQNGDPGRQQPNQLDLLRDTVKNYRVKLVVLSIGGNDLKFKDIITDCILGYLTPIGSYRCQPRWESQINGQLNQLKSDVGATINAIRKIVDDAQGKAGYQFVLQSYPSPLPAGDDFRIAESGPRFKEGGCPVWNSDADWAHNELVPTVAAQLKSVASARSVRFLDLQNTFSGREVCAKDAHQAGQGNNATNPVSGAESEWIRWAVTGLTPQGDLQESMHPNYYGQRALGTCLRMMYEKSKGNFECRNTRGAGPNRMTLSAI
ncbi:GDSL-type esterase/lipase family protein [Actinophytocola sp.]|uniref:GDSL-type esterase/lipase family protein n=1 Tax=Actinophytocola sp. TaxID=1872138 RepID=UPI003899AD9F